MRLMSRARPRCCVIVLWLAEDHPVLRRSIAQTGIVVVPLQNLLDRSPACHFARVQHRLENPIPRLRSARTSF